MEIEIKLTVSLTPNGNPEGKKLPGGEPARKAALAGIMSALSTAANDGFSHLYDEVADLKVVGGELIESPCPTPSPKKQYSSRLLNHPRIVWYWDKHKYSPCIPLAYQIRDMRDGTCWYEFPREKLPNKNVRVDVRVWFPTNGTPLAPEEVDAITDGRFPPTRFRQSGFHHIYEEYLNTRGRTQWFTYKEFRSLRRRLNA